MIGERIQDRWKGIARPGGGQAQIREGGDEMPTIFFYGPRLDREKKIGLVRNFTKAAGEATGILVSAFVVRRCCLDRW